LQPGLAALLLHDAVRSPRSQRVIKSLVSRSHRLLAGISQSGIVKAGQIAHSIISRSRHHPRITSIRKHVCEAAVVLKEKCRMRAQRLIRRSPVDRRIREIDIEIRDHRLTFNRHVSRRSEISFFDVLQIADQRLLRRTSRAGIPLDRSLIDHDGERKSGMSLGLRHHQLRRLINRVVLSEPIDNHAIDPAADHVIDLTLHLRRVRGTVADVHVIRSAEPQHQMGIDFRARSRIQQRMHVHLADVSRAAITIGLSGEIVGCARIISGLRCERGSRHNVGRTGSTYRRDGQHCYYN
jgi:hypothetical protein